MKNPTILISEGDEILRQILKRQLLSKPFDIIESNGIEDIARSLQNHRVDVVISCSAHKFPQDVLRTTKEIRRCNASVPIILIPRHSSEEMAIAALRAGVNDYLKTPFSDKAILASIQRNLSKVLSQHTDTSDSGIPPPHRKQPMIGQSSSMHEIKKYLLKVAATDSTVMITGETGTGKELAAEMIHLGSSRREKPFICVNCAALPDNLVESELFGYDRGAFTGAVAAKPGKFALAGGGSVFLDEIGDMSHVTQAKVLRSIERKEVFPLGGRKAVPLDIRVIAATNKDPEKLAEEGRFRRDLYYRLNVARVHMPPLRQRKEDIPLLVSHIIENLNRRFKRKVRGLTDEAMAILCRHDWPGNIRELMNLVEGAFIDLPTRPVDFMGLPRPLKKRLESSVVASQNERRQIVSALLDTKWNKSKAAQKLRWSRTTIYRKISQYNIVENRNRS